MGFFKSIVKGVRNFGRAIRKVAAPIGAIAGTAIGGPLGAKIGGSVGGFITGMFEKSNVPEISQPYAGLQPDYTPVLYGTPGYIGNYGSGGVTVEQDGTIVFPGGTRVPRTVPGSDIDWGKENDKIFGGPTTIRNSNSTSSATPLLFGLGALLLLNN